MKLPKSFYCEICVFNCLTNSGRIRDFHQFWLGGCFTIITAIVEYFPVISMKRMIMTEVSSAIKTPPVPSTKKGPRGEVRIFATWCKGCQICIEFCPTNVLAMHPNGNHPIVVAAEKCTACHFCDTHCPDLAILVKKIE